MRDFLTQIKKGLDENLYFLSLFSALTIPDLCGAMGSNNGKANAKKYKAWFDKYITPQYDGFLNGNDCYFFRCSLLHQGSSQHLNSSYKRVLFIEPSTTTHIFHKNIMNDALNIDVEIFCNDVIDGAEKWLSENEETEPYRRNYDKFMRRYPNGLSPYIAGVPVIS